MPPRQCRRDALPCEWEKDAATLAPMQETGRLPPSGRRNQAGAHAFLWRMDMATRRVPNLRRPRLFRPAAAAGPNDPPAPMLLTAKAKAGFVVIARAEAT